MLNVNRRYVADFDWTLLSMAVGLAAFGVLEIWSVTTTTNGTAPGFWRRQLLGVGIGLVVMYLTTLHDYRRILNAAPYLYGVGIMLLVLVLTPLGKLKNGNQSWLDLGSFSFQPSEMAKIFTIMFLAYYLAGVRKRPLDLRTVVVAVGIWALPTVLVFMENDTGSALSFTSFLAAMLFLAGVRWSWMAAALVAVVIVVIVAAPRIKNCESYKCERVKSVYWPDLAKKRFRYQNDQAEIAVGSGAVLGKGPRGSTQGSLGFLPEVHNDFIFAVASEEWGFIGSSLSLAIYLMIIARLIQIARRSRERIGMLLVAGIAALLLYHVAVNVGMVLRLLPIMGIPLPLMSSGSTSVVATCFGLGLAISVRLRRFVN
ncbi:MAG TPA: FtsW/RodA/SpoVE family cell cycle protein [Blastocatellia bacterium]|nr:FtsW/RodA/SpoVE family cell cycle protein [Blastocatellia bacterium]